MLVSDPRVHWNIRVSPGAKQEAKVEAVRESLRTGVRWSACKVGREWLRLGRLAWLKERENSGF